MFPGRGQNGVGWIANTHAAVTTSRLHVVLTFLLVKFALLLGCGVLVLLVLGHEIVHVGLSLGEFHLVHALACVPMKERLTTEHRREVFSHTLEHLLDGR